MIENKTGKPAFDAGKYFKYAIGEIILVVIGILIALQINNWKENNKLRNLETETLLELKEALVQDTLVLTTNLKTLEIKIIENKELIAHVKGKKPHIKRLDTLMINVYYHKGYNTFNTAAFELLKDRGFGIIKNKDLRKQITNHYTTDLADISSVLSRLDQINLIQGENMFKNFKIAGSIIHAYDYEELLNNPRVMGPFSHFETMNGSYLANLTEFKTKTKHILAVINSELDK
jgi:hypothetical protein